MIKTQPKIAEYPLSPDLPLEKPSNLAQETEATETGRQFIFAKCWQLLVPVLSAGAKKSGLSNIFRPAPKLDSR